MVPQIVFLNQCAGPLFRELAEDLVKELGPGELFSGHMDEITGLLPPYLSPVPSPGQRTSSSLARIVSWLAYIVCALPRLWPRRKAPLLFIVSNPPVSPWLGYLVRRLWGQRYAILIYDVYPEMLVRFASLAEHGLAARVWRWLNKLAFEHAEVVFTIGDYMAQTFDSMYDPAKTTAGQTVIIPNWADPEAIRPLEKQANWFAREHDQINRLTILYAGTIGLKHNVQAMIEAAQRLRHLEDIHFMFIGRGAGYNCIANLVETEQLGNTTVLPFMAESDIPYSLASGDVAVVALDRGGEGVYVPGKTFYAMAAGSALLALSSDENEVADIIQTYHCGLVVPPDDVESFVAAVHRFREDRDFLATCRRNARMALEQHFNRHLCTRMYLETLQKTVSIDK
jgi:glycosyltransferase involved in cell wall biosynthesis